MEIKPHSAILSGTITFAVIAVMMGIFAGSALAATSTSIRYSKHDFSESSTGSPFSGEFVVGAAQDDIQEICVFCHTPHAASTDAQTGTLLWNRTPSTSAYIIYTSSTITGPDSVNSGKPTGVSMMCMSCHDGVSSIAVNTLVNAPGQGNPAVVADPFGTIAYTGTGEGKIFDVYNGGALGWGANIGNTTSGNTTVDLSNDHPISFNYPPTRSDLQEPTGASGLRLFGTGKRVECATCHSVHNPSIEPFLAMSNSESLMCRECHLK